MAEEAVCQNYGLLLQSLPLIVGAVAEIITEFILRDVSAQRIVYLFDRFLV
jgi:hypothetical protein